MKAATVCVLHLSPSSLQREKAGMLCLHELNGWVLNTEFLIIMSDAQVGIAEMSAGTQL